MNMGILLKGDPLDSYYYHHHHHHHSSNNNNNNDSSSNHNMEEECNSATSGYKFVDQKYLSASSSASGIPTPMHSGENSGSEWDLPPLCAGCALRIVDDFYLTSVEKKWHASCLKCSECGGELEDQASCFEREGHIYCKEDFLKLQSSIRSCAKCQCEIRGSDLVMKARESYFHVECFRCATCDLTLVKGDLFGMVNEVLFCKDHYEEVEEDFEEEDLEDEEPFGQAEGPGGRPFYHHHHGGGSSNPFPGYGDWVGGGVQAPYESSWGGAPYPQGGPLGGVPPHGPPPPHLLDYPPFDNNNKPGSFKKRRGRKKRPKMITGEGFPAEGGVYGGESGLGPSGLPHDALGGAGGLGGQPKTKRARTSFKHHQLRIMKAHFQINQNPDSRELKMLSQKTGLDKKVLQVWFQNSRAKWRRTKTQDGVPASGGEDVLGLGDASSPASDCSGNGPLIPCC